jgi:hypothetical protein
VVPAGHEHALFAHTDPGSEVVQSVLHPPQSTFVFVKLTHAPRLLQTP